MSGTATFTFWQIFFIALVPALLTGAVGVLGPWLIDARKEKVLKKQKRAEKFESMIQNVLAHKRWMFQADNFYVFGTTKTEQPSPLPSAMAIQVTYFPELSEPMDDLERGASAYVRVLMALRVEKNEAKGKLPTDTSKKNLKGYREFLDKHHLFLKKAAIVAKDDFK